MLIYNRDDQGLPVEQPQADHLRALGWTDGQGIVLATERWPGPEVDARLQDLSRTLGVNIFYRFPQALAGIGAAASLTGLDRLMPRPGLFDLVLDRNDRGDPGFRIGPDRFVPLGPEVLSGSAERGDPARASRQCAGAWGGRNSRRCPEPASVGNGNWRRGRPR